MPQVTVITCVYNGLPYLQEAIESTLNQSYSNFEYLIIDDCSPDTEVVKVIKSYKDSRIRFYQNDENLGVSRTFNKALSLVTTPYVIRLDQDDVSLPNRIAEQIAYLDKHPEISIVCSWEHTIDSKGKKIQDWKRSIDNYGEFLGPVLVGLCPIWHPSIAFRTTAMIDSGGFKVGYTRAEDFEVTSRMALKRYGAAIVPKFHLLQRQHEASQSSQYDDTQVAITQKIHLEALKYFSNHPGIERLSNYLLLKSFDNTIKLNKQYLQEIRETLDDLYLNINNKQNLNKHELQSLKKIINKRIGLGLYYFPYISMLPNFVFYPCYYLLSPLQIPNVRKTLSKFYHSILGFRYIFK